MPEKRNVFFPCSERDVRAAALKSTHERLAEMDRKGQATVGKFGEILREEQAKFRAYGQEMAQKDSCAAMPWDRLKDAATKFAEQKKAETEE